MGGTRRNPITQNSLNISGRMAEMENKFQEGLDKLRKDYIEQTSSTPKHSNSTDFEERLKHFENEIRKELKNLKDEIRLVQSRMQKGEQTLEKLISEDNNRKILLRGIPEKKNTMETTGELLNIFNKYMNLNIERTEIATCYRLRKNDNTQKENKPSPVVVEFVTQWRRDEIFYNKRRLKGSSFSITEVLKRKEVQLFQRAREIFGRNSWTKRGKVFIYHDNKKVYITDENHLLSFN